MKKRCTTLIFKVNIKNNKAIVNYGKTNIYMTNPFDKLLKIITTDMHTERFLRNKWKKNKRELKTNPKKLMRKLKGLINQLIK